MREIPLRQKKKNKKEKKEKNITHLKLLAV